MGKATSKDRFMQFFVMVDDAETCAADNTAVNTSFDTGLGVRGDYGWLIHHIAMWHGYSYGADITTTDQTLFAVSTRKGLTSYADFLPTAEGVIDAVYIRHSIYVAAAGTIFWPHARQMTKFLPPLPFAKPKLYTYLHCSDITGVNFDVAKARIGYTTMPLTPEEYVELAEVWWPN